jgi:predicted ATPase
MDDFREAAHRQLMTALAQSDRRAEASAHYEILAEMLRRELDLRPSQKTRELVAQIQAGETVTIPFADGLQVPTSNLPQPLTPFIGREAELAAITAQLEAGDCRLLTLHGPGGAGKTRLALEFARRSQEQYAQGAHFVPLAGLTSPENLITTVASIIGLQIRPDREPRLQLLHYLRTRQMLMLLDNFEHLKEGAGLLIDILQAAPRVQILVTSRDRLQLAAECIFEVGGLRTDSENGKGGLPSDPAEDPEAVQMFEAYARRVHPVFQPDDVGRTAVAGLCRLVEGMPLAIELAAAWVRALSPAAILEQIAAGSKLLATTSADIPPRLRSVRASFNYSWGLLAENEQQALMQLSVFRGGCTRDSAEAVSGTGPFLLAALADKSMLTYDAAAGRYSLHELIRQLAEERLAESRREAATRRRHAGYFKSCAEEAWLLAERGSEWEAYYRRIDPELDNCRVALQNSFASGDTETALQLSTALAEYLNDHGMGQEALRWLEKALAEDDGRSAPAVRAAAYLSLSWIWYATRGGRRTVIELAKKGLALYQITEDQEGVARALHGCAVAYHGDDWDRSRDYLKEAIAAYEEAGIDHWNSWHLLENIEILTGNLDRARSLIARRRSFYEKNGDESGIMYTNTWLAFVNYYEGRIDKAQYMAEEALHYRRANSPEWAHILPLDLLIVIALDKGRLNRARSLLCERLRIMVNLKLITNAIFCFDEVAEWLLLTGHPRQAAYWLGCFDQAREWAKQPVEPVALPRYQWLVSEVRGALSEEAYTAAWQKGYAVHVEDALPLALQVMEQTAVKTTSDNVAQRAALPAH